MIDAPIGDRSSWEPQWPELEDSTIKLGEAALVREGTSGTVISYGRPLPL